MSVLDPKLSVSLVGKAVVLEPLEPRHIPDLTRIALAHPDEFALTSTPTDSEASEAYFSKAFEMVDADRAHVFAMLDADASVIGTTRYTDIDWTNKTCELGYTWFDPTYFGTAVNVESKLLLLRHIFEQLEFLRVQINVDTRNIHSQHAIRALGASFEGTLRSHKFSKDGYRRDTHVFSIIAAQWAEVKGGLESRLAKKRA